MKSSALQSLSFICLCAAGLSSCIVQKKIIVPDMPHDSMWRERARQAALAAGANNAALHPGVKPQPTTPATDSQPTPLPAEQPQQQETPVTTPQTPVAAPATPQNSTITKPATPTVQPTTPAVKVPTTSPAQTTVTKPATPTPTVTAPTQPVKTTITPAVTPTVPATPTTSPVATEPAKPKPDLSHITNENGYIPYAKPVPGDPTRVYNPLAPELTLRIVDKTTGQPYPRDTKLKVPGTNFFFKIP